MSKRTKFRQAVHSALIALLALLISLGAAEALVRIFDLAPAVGRAKVGRFQISSNPLIGYEPIATGIHNGGRYNSLGFSDVEHSHEKDPEVFRILVIGDSVADGFGVERVEDIFPRILEEELRTSGSKVEVINLGIMGYNTRQEVALLAERGLAYSPDLVLLAYCLNDRRVDDGFIMAGLWRRERALERDGLISIVDGSQMLFRSKLLLLAYSAYRNLRSSSRGSGDLGRLKSFAEDSVVESLGILKDLSRRADFSVLVTVFPYLRDFETYSLGNDHDWIAQEAHRIGIDVLDLLPAMKGCRNGLFEEIRVDELHPNPIGHRCAAQAIAEHISPIVSEGQ